MNVSRSPIDEARFGIGIARASLDAPDGLPDVLAFCKSEQIAMLIARCPVTSIATAHALERAGGLLMDTLIYFARPIADMPAPEPLNGAIFRLANVSDRPGVAQVAAEAFTNYHGHYHADPRLDPALCDAGYVEWAVNTCIDPTESAAMLVADVAAPDGAPTLGGFGTVRLNSPKEGEGVLFAVAPFAQGRGIYRNLLLHSAAWCQQHGASTLLYSTQVTNHAAQTMMARLGFAFQHAYYTFHLWFE